MGPAGPVGTKKFAYGPGGGKTGLFDCVRPATGIKAIWSSSQAHPYYGRTTVRLVPTNRTNVLVKMHKIGKKDCAISTMKFT